MKTVAQELKEEFDKFGYSIALAGRLERRSQGSHFKQGGSRKYIYPDGSTLNASWVKGASGWSNWSISKLEVGEDA